jgi:hypothetical protein
MKQCIATCLDLIDPADPSNGTEMPCNYNKKTGKCEYSVLLILCDHQNLICTIIKCTKNYILKGTMWQMMKSSSFQVLEPF